MTDELLDYLHLSLTTGIGPRLRTQLLECFGTPAAVLDAPPVALREVPGIGPELARRLAVAREESGAEDEIAFCDQQQIKILTQRCPDYPRGLQEIPDPPGVLFVKGELRPQDALAVSIVGSRHATSYGLAQAERLGGALARAGLTVISGLARGIDGAAHRGALAAGGRTIGVLGSGVSNIYPPEHVELAAQVVAAGVLISESPPRSPPLAGAFPQRNRIITGMSLGVIVVEASLNSGALISARHAMEQGREVFAVPGRIDSRMSKGCHRLIRDGVKLVESIDDVLEELGPLVAPTADANGETVHHPAELALNELEREVLAAIPTEAVTVDAVLRSVKLTPPQVLATLNVLEMRRLIRRLSGNLVQRR
jgi:DNA processing protein